MIPLDNICWRDGASSPSHRFWGCFQQWRWQRQQQQQKILKMTTQVWMWSDILLFTQTPVPGISWNFQTLSPQWMIIQQGWDKSNTDQWSHQAESCSCSCLPSLTKEKQACSNTTSRWWSCWCWWQCLPPLKKLAQTQLQGNFNFLDHLKTTLLVIIIMTAYDLREWGSSSCSFECLKPFDHNNHHTSSNVMIF